MIAPRPASQTGRDPVAAVRPWTHVAGPRPPDRDRQPGHARGRDLQAARRATRSGSSVATGPARPRCSRSSRAKAPQPGAWCCAPTRSATSPRTPSRAAPASTTPRSSHVLSGRGLDAAAQRVEKLRLRIEEHPTEKDVAKFARAEEEFRDAGGYAAESEVRRIAAGLGLTEGRLDLPIDALSGGERRRVELGRILFAGSELLLLDEPTNHLDNDAKEWLVGFLRQYRGALLVVSHDLELLDTSITRVLHLHDGVLTEYRGTYSQYVTARAADEERLARLATRQGAGDRPAPPPRRRDAGPEREASQDREGVRHPRQQAAAGARHRPEAREADRGEVPRPAARRERRADRRRPGQGLRRAAGVHTTSSSPSGAASASS